MAFAIGAVLSSDTAAKFDELQEVLTRVASTLEMNGLGTDYTRVSRAAREMDLTDLYTRIITVLSKFVHPTALVTNSPLVDKMVGFFSDKFIHMADVCASEVFETVKREQKKIRCGEQSNSKEATR